MRVVRELLGRVVYTKRCSDEIFGNWGITLCDMSPYEINHEAAGLGMYRILHRTRTRHLAAAVREPLGPAVL